MKKTNLNFLPLFILSILFLPLTSKSTAQDFETLSETLKEALPLFTTGVDKHLTRLQRVPCNNFSEEKINKLVSYSIKNGVVTKNGVPIRINGNKVTSFETPPQQNDIQEIEKTISYHVMVPLPAVQSLIDQALDFEIQGELEKAVSLIERALNISPQYPPLYLKLAELNILQNHFANAYNLTLKGLSKRPDEATKKELHKIKVKAQNYKSSRPERDTSYQREIKPPKLKMVKPKSLIQQADESIANKHFDEAAEKLEDIIKSDPNNYETYNKLIAIKMSQKFFTEAKEIAEKAQLSQMSTNDKMNLRTKSLEAQIEIEKVNLLKMQKGK